MVIFYVLLLSLRSTLSIFLTLLTLILSILVSLKLLSQSYNVEVDVPTLYI